MNEWAPHVTVAAVIERDGRFLLVEELADGKAVLNQPAGHLEPGESLLAAVVRETHEETGHRFVPEALVGIYRWVHPGSGETMLRLCFCGEIEDRGPQYPLDPDILDTHWLTLAELDSGTHRMRSPLVRRCLDDYRAGRRSPLDLLHEL